jgi:hypothetical protein
VPVFDLNADYVLDLLLSPVCQILIADFLIVLSRPVKVDELDATCVEKNIGLWQSRRLLLPGPVDG